MDTILNTKKEKSKTDPGTVVSDLPKSIISQRKANLALVIFKGMYLGQILMPLLS